MTIVNSSGTNQKTGENCAPVQLPCT